MNFNHLTETQKTYVTHLVFACGSAVRLLLLCVVSVIHGLIPFVFGKTTSNGVKKLQERFE